MKQKYSPSTQDITLVKNMIAASVQALGNQSGSILEGAISADTRLLATYGSIPVLLGAVT